MTGFSLDMRRLLMKCLGDLRKEQDFDGDSKPCM